MKCMTQNFITSPRHLKTTIKPTQNFRTLLGILMISKHSYKVSKDNLKMGNIPFSYGVNLLLLFLHAHEGGTSHNLLYVRQMYIPFHLSISPEAHIEVSHLKGEENEPRHSDSTVPSVRQITSQFYFFKDFAPELLGCLDGSVG